MQAKILIAAPLLLIVEVARAAPGEASARLAESPLSTANLIETAVGLAIVLAVMLGLAWLVKRYVHLPGIGKGQVQVLGGVSLGAREKAVLLTVQGKRVLVGVAPGQVRTLMVLDEEDEQTDQAFAEQLAEASKGRVEQDSGAAS